jgi:hypothetical protein
MVIAVTAGFATSASAEGSPDETKSDVDFNRTGFYVGAGASYTTDFYEGEVEDSISNSTVNIHTTPGANARVGFRFWRALAVELQYEWLDEYDIDFSYGGVGGKIAVDQMTLTGNLKIYPVPFWRIQPYILAGVGFQIYDLTGQLSDGTYRINQNGTALAARAAVGLDVYITQHLALFGEFGAVYTDEAIDIPNAVGSDIPFILYAGGQVGLMWRF